MLTNDPAKWIVVGILACLHFTYWAWKKSTTPFAWSNLLTGFAALFLTGCRCIIVPIFHGGRLGAESDELYKELLDRIGDRHVSFI